MKHRKVTKSRFTHVIANQHVNQLEYTKYVGLIDQVKDPFKIRYVG